MPDVLAPQTKRWLVRPEVFQIGVRPGSSRWTVHDEILVVLPELVDGREELRFADLVVRLNPDNDERRWWAVEKAVWRMAGTSGMSLPLIALGIGRCHAADGRNAMGSASFRG